MKLRCYNLNQVGYKNYGARGIKICDEWLDKDNGFINFYNWATNNGYRDDLSIDRIDNNGDYEPNNCRWSTSKSQSNHKRNNKYITYRGQQHTIAEWSDLTGLSYHLIWNRLKRGWTPCEIFERKNKYE